MIPIDTFVIVILAVTVVATLCGYMWGYNGRDRKYK